MIERDVLLRHHEPFNRFSGKELDVVISAFTRYRFLENEKLIVQDQVVKRIGFIVSGEVDLRIRRLNGEDLRFSRLKKGDFFGVMSFEPNGRSMVSAVGRVPGVICVQERDSFFRMIEKAQSLKDYFYKMSLERVWNAYEKVYHNTETDDLDLFNHGYVYEVHKSINFIDHNFMNSITLEDTASKNGMSKFHFSRLFKEKTGLSFKEYLNIRRIHEAKKIFIIERLNVSETCYKVGFNDQSYFCRVFKKLEGYTPSEFKRICSHK